MLLTLVSNSAANTATRKVKTKSDSDFIFCFSGSFESVPFHSRIYTHGNQLLSRVPMWRVFKAKFVRICTNQETVVALQPSLAGLEYCT